MQTMGLNGRNGVFVHCITFRCDRYFRACAEHRGFLSATSTEHPHVRCALKSVKIANLKMPLQFVEEDYFGRGAAHLTTQTGRARVVLRAHVRMESALTDAEGYNLLAPQGIARIVPMPVPQHIRLIFPVPELSVEDEPVITFPRGGTASRRRVRNCIELQYNLIKTILIAFTHGKPNALGSWRSRCEASSEFL